MRSILDIASWSALVLLVVTAISGDKPAPPEPPVPPENVHPAAVNEEALEKVLHRLDSFQTRVEKLAEQVVLVADEMKRVSDDKSEPTPVVVGVNWQYSLESAWTESQRTGKPAFVHWSMAGCKPCSEMDQFVFTDQQVVRLLNENFIPCKVDARRIDRQTREGWGVSAVPTSFSVTHDWKKMRRIHPTRDPRQYAEQLVKEIEWTKGYKEKSVVIEPVAEETKNIFYVEPYSCYPSYSAPAYSYPVYRYSYPSYGYGGGGCASGRCGW